MRMAIVFVIGTLVGLFLSDYVVALGRSFGYAVGRISGGG